MGTVFKTRHLDLDEEFKQEIIMLAGELQEMNQAKQRLTRRRCRPSRKPFWFCCTKSN